MERQTVHTLIRLLWVCTVCPDLSVRKLRIIMVLFVELNLQLTTTQSTILCIEFMLNHHMNICSTVLRLNHHIKYYL